jgi:hypothetical protein
MGIVKHHFSSTKSPYGRYQGRCSCGWVALGTDSSERSARQAHAAHLYAKGHRTTRDVRQATT